MRLPLPRYPPPGLQANPREDMAELHDEEMKWLNGSGWIDKAHGVVHIPISDAMRLITQEAAPGWPTPKEKRRRRVRQGSRLWKTRRPAG